MSCVCICSGSESDCISGSAAMAMVGEQEGMTSAGVITGPWAEEVAPQSLHCQTNTYTSDGETNLVFVTRSPGSCASIDDSCLKWLLLCCLPNSGFSVIPSAFPMWHSAIPRAFLLSLILFVHVAIYVRVDS